MKIKFTLLLSGFLLASALVFGQSAKDITVPIAADVNPSPLSVIVTFENPDTSNILILRRTKGQTGAQWVQAYSQANTTITGIIDNSVVAGQTYEYVIQRTRGTLNAYGYAHVAVGAAAVDNRGKVLVIVDSTTADALGVELVRMKNDMRGDGWVTKPVKIGPSATVTSVKNLIKAEYNADPTNLKAVFLIGRVPVPYSGSSAWDGHPEHAGAWPCDNYYADINGVWTDNTVNISAAGRPQTNNIPGDGKFDQNFIPTPTELQIGRLDFRHLTQGTFGATEIELLRRYLDKNHKFRSKQYVPDTKAIIDDNFGYFSGEAFAASGFRNAYPIVGDENIVLGDFFNDTDANSYLMGYGCGGGNYQGAGGVGSSSNFGADSVNIVFSNLFGSYFGDWDYDTDPFMPAALASKGSILTCGWAGRPTFFLHSMASGETIGYAMKETQNAPTNNGFYGSFGEGGAHIALLGDPTLRAFVVEPPTNLAVTQKCNNVNLTWTAPVDTNIIGYYVYRSTALDGPYTRVTPNWLTTNTYTETSPGVDTFYYQVRSLYIEYTAGGGIWINNSIGPIQQAVIVAATAPVVTAIGGAITCLQDEITLNVSANQAIQSVSWAGPNGYSSNVQNPSVSVAGQYTVTVTAQNGCSNTNTALVAENTVTPVIPAPQVSNGGVLTCSVLSVNVSVATIFECIWQGPNGYYKTGTSVSMSTPGVYELLATNTLNGCSSTTSVTINQNTTAPTISIANPATLTCALASTTINLSAGNNNTYSWFGPGNYISVLEDPTVTIPGTYSVTVTNSVNGCSSTSTVSVAQDIVEPSASITGNLQLTCSNASTVLTGTSNAPNATYAWTGPGGFTASTNTINVTVSGDYILTVRATNGCTSSSSVSVTTDGTVPNASAVASNVLTCSSPATTLQGGSTSPNITEYSWTGPNGYTSTQQNPSVNNPGLYTLTVKANNGCTAQANVTVLEDKAIPVYSLEPYPALNCLISCVNLKAIPSNIILSPSEICLSGDFEVIATGSNGCTVSSVVTIFEAPALQVNIAPVTVGCVGPNTATAITSGGTPPYQYLWSNGDTTATTTLPAQPPFTLGLTVTDAGGCVAVFSDVTIVQPPAISTNTPVVTNCTTSSSNDGAISLSPTGGSGIFTYLWSTNATAPSISNLSAGVYTCTITDVATGCTATTSVTVTAPVATFEIDGLQSLQLSPNPSTGQSTLQLKLDQEMDVLVTVMDVTGRLIWANPLQHSLETVVKIDLGNAAPGVYTVMIQLDQQAVTRKLVLVEKP
ncbi:MAG: T9SS type A sorting domain-containing protein [Saprospiraceae bacterium]|nr:T9SS type A sorting domain-containing protein [Saprospiraceae bacterium]